MYRAKLLNVLHDWLEEPDRSDLGPIAYGAWATMLSRTTTKATAKEVADEMQKAIDDMRSEDDYEDTHMWEGDLSIQYHYEVYDVASAIVKAFRKIYVEAEATEQIPF